MEQDTQLAKWLAGELQGEQLQELQNSPRYATLVKIKEQFERIQQPQFNSEDMLQSILRAEKATVKVVPLYRRPWLQAVAAGIVLLVGLAIFYAMPENVSADRGETFAFTLPDESNVLLNAGSEASYSKRGWDDEREISLEGEAYFKVAKGKTFEVKTPEGTVTVLGTQFNVKAREGRFEVVCYEGKVRVEHKNREFILMPGQGITFAHGEDTGVTGVTVAEPQWLHKELVFINAKLDEVIAELERHYNVEIETDHKSAQVYSGSLPGDDISAAVKGLSLTYHLQVSNKNNAIHLIPVNAGR